MEAIIVYGSCIFLGAGGSTLLVTSLSMVADLIGCTTVRSECVCLGRGKRRKRGRGKWEGGRVRSECVCLGRGEWEETCINK